MYHLLISIALPDYKRPSVSTHSYYFNHIENAERGLISAKNEYISDNQLTDDHGELITVDKLDVMIYSGELDKIIYCDSYMDIPPFSGSIYEIIAMD